ncbi:ATP-binding cassette domain-containing protein [Clostridium estertheticum]|uniref:ABC transporter ATP-binding protein n=1 Tax=Clostridium estertheticum TaxID=238834 RepID=UPI001CCACC6C|nr:ATP-binding cassette domain-containing protein [Clostridium estertheticum]MBZ9607394.1 ATP-binding cassette domain-containing protein [Clostridium estertheticum]MBZ9609410.1 ATP-binding cassette domain-containing protein [Clostridium estertheticum]
MEEIIKVEHITKDYGNGRGIFDFNFSVKRGQIYGLVGTNGSGKTTTLRSMMGFVKPDKGNVSILGMDAWKDAFEIKKFIGYVPGEIDFPDVGTGTTFLKLQAEFLGIKDMTYTNELIDMFKLDTDAELRRMSKGMKQKTALVAAFMSKPDILLLDEPSTGLDPLMRDMLIELILEHKRLGKTVFMSSHIFKELEATCDAVAFIHNGHFINFVERSMRDPDMAKIYKVGFEDTNEYEKFANSKKFKIHRKNDNYKHLMLFVDDGNINELFAELAKYNIRYIKYIPYTLEFYYTQIIEKEIKIQEGNKNV